MIEQASHVGFGLSVERKRLADQMSDQLRSGYTIAVVAPPRYQSEQFARAIAEHASRIMGVAEYIDIELEKFAFHPAPLPAIYAELLNRLGVCQTVGTEDQLLKVLRATKSVWDYRVVIFHKISALSREVQLILSTVLRSFGNDPELEHRIRPIVTGGIELLELTRSNDLGVSPLNGAEVVELQPFSTDEIGELFPWSDCFGTLVQETHSAAVEIKDLTGGHPGLVNLLAQHMKRSGQSSLDADASNIARTIRKIGLSAELLEDRFIVRTLQPFSTSMPTFQAITSIISGRANQIDRRQFEAMRLTGAVFSNEGKPSFNGEIFKEAARRSFGPSAIAATIRAAGFADNRLTFTKEDGVHPVQPVKEALEQAARLLVQCFGYQYVHVFVADEARRVLQGVLVISGLDGGEPKQPDVSEIRVSYHKPTSLVGRAAKQMAPVLSRDVIHDDNRDVELWKRVGSPTGAVLNLPITLDGRELFGVLGVGATTVEELESSADDLRRLALDIVPILKHQQLALLRQLLATDAQKYGGCCTRRDVVRVLCDSLFGALQPLSVAVYRRVQMNWEPVSQTGENLNAIPTIKAMILGHLEHVRTTPTQVCHRIRRDGDGKPVIVSSVAMKFHTQAALANSGDAGGLDFAVMVLSQAPFDSPEHHVLETFDTMTAAVQLAVSPLRLVSQREYTMLQFLYREALHSLQSPLWDLNLSCTLATTAISELAGSDMALRRVQNVRENVVVSLKRIQECREELQAVLSISKEDAVTSNFRTEVLDQFENVHIDDQGIPVPKVKGNPVIWRQCIRNLISNAREASEDGGPIDIIVRFDVDLLHVIVRDNGSGLPSGVPPEELFKPFFTTKPTRNNESRGFGLAFCRMMVEDQFGGTLSIANREDGRGVEVKMSIPLATTGVT